jgi:hypothetical protein
VKTCRDLGEEGPEFKLPCGISAVPELPYSMAMQTLVTALKWFASVSGIVAALMVSLDSGRRITGWGFVIFVGSSIAWIAGAALTKDGALGTQNAVLFAVNLFGVYRYLVRKKADA